MNITQNAKDRIYSIRGGMNSYGPYLDGRDIRDAFHYQHGRFFRQNGWDGKSTPKLEWEHSREQVEQAQTCQGWQGLQSLLERDDLNRLLYPLAKGDIGKAWTTVALPLVDELYGHLQLRVRHNSDNDYLFFDDGQLINALKAYDKLPWNYGEELQPLLEAYQTAAAFHLATATAQNRCEFLELLFSLATTADCRDVWDYFRGHPLASVRTFHQRLCIEFDGADYNDLIVQDALMRLMREAGMYGWLVMGQVAMPEDADDWHSGFAYAETFEQAMADILQWAERAREVRA